MAAPSAVDSSERARHGHAALLGLQFEEEVHGGGAPVRPQRGQWAGDAAAMASVMSRTWNAMPSTQAREVGVAGAAGETRDEARRGPTTGCRDR